MFFKKVAIRSSDEMARRPSVKKGSCSRKCSPEMDLESSVISSIGLFCVWIGGLGISIRYECDRYEEARRAQHANIYTYITLL